MSLYSVSYRIYSIVYTNIVYTNIVYTNIVYICMYSRTHCNPEVPSRMGLSKPSLKPSLLLFRDGFASSALLAPFRVVGLSWVMMVGAVDREVHNKNNNNNSNNNNNAIEHRAQPSPAQPSTKSPTEHPGHKNFVWVTTVSHLEPRIERRRRRRRKLRNTTPPANASTASTAHSQSGHPVPVGYRFRWHQRSRLPPGETTATEAKRSEAQHSTTPYHTTPHHNIFRTLGCQQAEFQKQKRRMRYRTAHYITLHRHRLQEIHRNRNRNRNRNRPLLPIASCHDRMSNVSRSILVLLLLLISLEAQIRNWAVRVDSPQHPVAVP